MRLISGLFEKFRLKLSELRYVHAEALSGLNHKPEDIVILKDVRSEFQTNVVSVEVENNQCKAVYRRDYTLGCDMFDGQALIDLSICLDVR